MSVSRRRLILACGPYRLSLNRRPHLMGIINVTDDSFSDGGRYATPVKAYRHAQQLVAEGADILDLGAESTRPGAVPVSTEEELRRLLPALKKIKKLNVPISIDTYKPEVAQAVIAAGAHMINDITGGRNPKMLQVLACTQIPVILMHMSGTPQTMQKAPRYKNEVLDVKAALMKSAQAAIKSGIKAKNIILDPGIGFGKTINHNLQLIKEVNVFVKTGYPILMGLSRKSFIGKILNKPSPGEREWGTAAAVSMCIAGGAHIVRVHDVKTMSMVSKVTTAIKAGQWGGVPTGTDIDNYGTPAAGWS